MNKKIIIMTMIIIIYVINIIIVIAKMVILLYCSIGDWFLLYQMNKNMNKRFFAEFLALLSLKVFEVFWR